MQKEFHEVNLDQRNIVSCKKLFELALKAELSRLQVPKGSNFSFRRNYFRKVKNII